MCQAATCSMFIGLQSMRKATYKPMAHHDTDFVWCTRNKGREFQVPKGKCEVCRYRKKCTDKVKS
jgi:hypothetical protein